MDCSFGCDPAVIGGLDAGGRRRAIRGRGTEAARLIKEGGEAAGFTPKPRGREALEADANRRMIGSMDETARAGRREGSRGSMNTTLGKLCNWASAGLPCRERAAISAACLHLGREDPGGHP